MHEYVIYCFRLPDGGPFKYAVGISVGNFIGAIGMLTCGDSDLPLVLGHLNLDQTQVNQIVTALSQQNSMYVLSGISVSDLEANLHGISLHDGDRPDETNQINVSKCSEDGQELKVEVVLNDQIMPAPTTGCFPWHRVKECLVNAGVLTDAQVHDLRTMVEQNGSGVADWTGVSTEVIKCLGKC
jgi:hypothetical protein